MAVALSRRREVRMFKTFGAAIGAAVVLLLLATMASRLTTRSEPMAMESAALHR
jgi:Na+-translocating ferredoxin:NAD+ oxidoreductase RnfA subunit